MSFVSNNKVALDRTLQGKSASTFREVKAQSQSLSIMPTADDIQCLVEFCLTTTRPLFPSLISSSFYL